jgi:hypothetical protein
LKWPKLTWVSPLDPYLRFDLSKNYASPRQTKNTDVVGTRHEKKDQYKIIFDNGVQDIVYHYFFNGRQDIIKYI